MATRKREVVVKRLLAGGSAVDDMLEVYADAEFKDVITHTEGVTNVMADAGDCWFLIETDPRYDTDEVAADIERAILDATEARALATVAEAERVLAQEPAP